MTVVHRIPRSVTAAATPASRHRRPGVQPFHMESISAGDCAVLRVAGEIDVYTAPELRQRVIHLLDNGSLHIIADLCGVDFLDSTGLGALVGSLKRLRMRGGSLKLVTGGGRILQIFRITGLTPCLRAPLLGLGRHHRRPALAGNPRGTRRQDQRMVPEKRARVKPPRRAGRHARQAIPSRTVRRRCPARAAACSRRLRRRAPGAGSCDRPTHRPSDRQTLTEPVQ